MRFFEFNPLKPLTPEQSRIAGLKRNADNARMALKRERKAQKIKNAQKAIQKQLQINSND